MRNLLARASRWAEFVSGLLVAAILVAIVVGVVRRYVFGAPLSWIDELTSVLFVWCIFWTGALVVREREHVAFGLMVDGLPARARRGIGLLAALIVGVALLAALPKTTEFIAFLWRERTPALQWRLDYVYACFVLFIGASALRFLWRAFVLSSRRWRDHV